MGKEIEMKKEIEGYNDLVRDIRSILQKGLGRAYKAVDNIKVQTYWQVGDRIVREELTHKNRADYGQRVIDNLAKDLSFRRDELYRIVQFYKTYPIVVTVSQQLSWSHYVELIKIKGEERKFYEIQSVREGWSIRELRKKIKDNEYKQIKKKGQLTVKLPPQLPAPEDVFKDVYNWNFLELEKNHDEKQLEGALLNNIQKILLEFGHGFAFMGSQQKILIAGQWHKVDLVFYHRFLKCIVLVELKTEKFKPEFVGQANKYLTYFRENKLEDERDPIGLIICKEKNDEEVHYALGKLSKDIFVAEYKAYLPSEKEIKEKLKD
ncbi:MAG: PDDEXK nuclease domain-containing protein [Candidatus Woesearchaeota archaeon]|nr:PDDEXK nuclease domain-containing protein [Candidatus Woesearchaeota archaeon]